MFNEILQQLDFVRSKEHGNAILEDLHPGEVRCDVAETDMSVCCRLLRPSNCCLDTRQQLAWTEWLRHIIVCAQLQQQNFVRYLRNRAKNHDRRARSPAFYPLTDLEA